MKRIPLLALSLVAAASFAQTTLWNGEDVNGALWSDGSPEIVANPETDGINTSATCIKLSMTANNKLIKIPFMDWVKPAMNGSMRVSLMIKKTTDDNVQIELSNPTDGSKEYWYRVATWYGGSGKWQKLVFDFTPCGAFDHPGLATVTAQTGDVTSPEDVYIDNVQIEPATLVGGQTLAGIADGSLTGDLTLSGAWMKGSCVNTTGEWTDYAYDDFAALRAKLSASATSVDMTGCELKDAYNPFREANSNLIVYADSRLEGDNVVVDGAAETLTLNADHAFNAPKGFTAGRVNMYRPVHQGYSTLCLPFEINAQELGADALATYRGVSGEADKTVTFGIVETVGANTPMLVSSSAYSQDLIFENKTVAATPASLASGEFVGVYAPQGAEGLWGIADGNMFAKGGAEASLKAFGAYLNMPSAASLVMDVTSGIGSVRLSENAGISVYNINGVKVSGVKTAADLSGLAKGLYIINNKKVIVR